MSKKTSVLLVLILAAILILPLRVQAGVISTWNTAVDPDDYIGSLSTALNEVRGFDGYAEPWGFQIAYEVIDDTEGDTGKFIYRYTITSTFDEALLKGISHFLLGLSLDVTAEELTITSDPAYTETEGPKWWRTTDPGSSNPNLPNDFFAIKIGDFEQEADTLTVEAKIGRYPVWGNFYVADGKLDGVDAVAYNMGFENMAVPGYFIPVPDTQTVPEPGTLLLIGSLLIGLGVIKRKF